VVPISVEVPTFAVVPPPDVVSTPGAVCGDVDDSTPDINAEKLTCAWTSVTRSHVA